MNTQPTRRQVEPAPSRGRGGGRAGRDPRVAGVPDERILERQGMIDYHTAAIRQALAAEAGRTSGSWNAKG